MLMTVGGLSGNIDLHLKTGAGDFDHHPPPKKKKEKRPRHPEAQGALGHEVVGRLHPDADVGLVCPFGQLDGLPEVRALGVVLAPVEPRGCAGFRSHPPDYLKTKTTNPPVYREVLLGLVGN